MTFEVFGDREILFLYEALEPSLSPKFKFLYERWFDGTTHSVTSMKKSSKELSSPLLELFTELRSTFCIFGLIDFRAISEVTLVEDLVSP